MFDKTGTLTEGKPSLTDIVTVPGVAETDLLRLAASADAESEHPLASAIVTAARARGVPLEPARGFEAIAGAGVRATVGDRVVLVGNRSLLERDGVPIDLVERAEQLHRAAKTIMYVAADGRLLRTPGGRRPRSAQCRRMPSPGCTRSASGWCCSRETTARPRRPWAGRWASTPYAPKCLPGDKAAEVRALEQGGARVAMVGDGVNDAPALAAASVGIAIGAGTDVAVETAGIVLMRDDPADVPRALILARSVRKKIVQNLFWAAIYNVVAIPLAAGALYPSLGVLLKPAWAALAMSASTVTVTVNALLLPRPR